jgi:hypothetical protein
MTEQEAVKQKLLKNRGNAKQGAGVYASSKSNGLFLLVCDPQFFSWATNNAQHKPHGNKQLKMGGL